MIEVLTNVIETTLNSFDFGFCIISNVLTYIIIKTIEECKKNISLWIKRLILLGVILAVGIIYYIINTDVKLILNSAILAPVFWSWVMKPLCKMLNVDYKNINYYK